MSIHGPAIETASGVQPLSVRDAKKLAKKKAAEVSKRDGKADQEKKTIKISKKALLRGLQAVRPRISPAPWVLLFALSAGSGGGSYYLMQRNKLVAEELSDARAASMAAEQREAGADGRIMELEAALSEVKGEFAAAKEIGDKKAAEADELATKLEALVSNGNGELIRDEGGRLSLQLVDQVLFRLGEASLTERGMSVLGEVGKALNNYPDRQIWVQGHTDDMPISTNNTDFESNWELSAARALTVVHYLQDQSGLDPKRLAAVAFGQHRPVSRKNKARNRRIEIVLFPQKVQLIKD